MAKSRAHLFDARYFGLIIAAALVVIFFLLGFYTSLFRNLGLKTLDLQYRMKTQFTQKSVQQGVTIQQQNPKISPNILIVGIDLNSLDKFGKWPWPRYRFADFINGFTRIQDQSQRERALFLDVFFIDPDRVAYNDALLVKSIQDNKRVFLETVLDEQAPPLSNEQEYFNREKILAKKWGELTNVTGNWQRMYPFFGVEPPLTPYGEAAHGYGHANFFQDKDATYRRQPLVAKLSEPVRTYRVNDLTSQNPGDELTTQTKIDPAKFQRLEWTDKNGIHHNIKYPLTASSLSRLRAEMKADAPLKVVKTDQSGKVIEGYNEVTEYEDHFIPSITLSLAADYFHAKISDIKVELGNQIVIPDPQMYDTQSKKWVPYRKLIEPAVYDAKGQITKPAVTQAVSAIHIPIDAQGTMLINFMGPPSSPSPTGHQTFPIRSFYGYAARATGPDPSTWPRTRAVANDIIMVGAFAKGLSDEKPTPYGLMNGVEIHANALNSIITDNFLHDVPAWLSVVILAVLILFVGFITSRVSTIWSLITTFVLVVAYFIFVTLEFEYASNVFSFVEPAIGVIVTFVTIVVYRVMTEERDKARIRDMFGKFVSPSVVDQILENPPELGGVDKELTVFFSDIRGFTTLSESMTPQELVNHLNVYLTAMTNIIMESHGTLDKYEGDAIMCFWGAPLPQEDHALRACRCALRQMQALEELNETWPEEKRLAIGIGINSGIMTVGNMGSLGRMDYTIMGDAVNLGARLEGTNKQYGTHIIISENTYGLVRDHVVVRELDNIRVKGKNKPVLIYELLDMVEPVVDGSSGNGAGQVASTTGP